jgi:uncharacterized YccA/Bax inhibitor family protein
MDNPAFSQSPAFSTEAALRAISKDRSGGPVLVDRTKLAEFFTPPGTDPSERMSYEDTIAKTAISFLVLLAAAAIGWIFPVLTIPGALAAIVLMFINVFRRTPRPGLVLGYAAAEGLFVGGISQAYAGFGAGIVPIALFGTLGVVGVTLALFVSGKVRASRKATRFFLVALVGYAAFSLVNLGLMALGVTDSMFGLRDVPLFGIPLGVPLGIIAVLLGAYALVLDFEQITFGVEHRQRRIHGWTGAFGILVTVVWLYLQILRIVTLVTRLFSAED